MDLLNEILRQPIDPDYARVAAGGVPPQRHRWALAVVTALCGALVAVAALQTTRSAPAIETERAELISRIQAAEQEQDELRSKAEDLGREIRVLRAAALDGDADAGATVSRINRLEPIVGTVAVAGPGVVVTVDDAPSASDGARDRVLDVDLQVLANGLWQAGAEAVAINGHRLSVLTAIRGAGDAVTVDYRSLQGPYRVEAIGDPRTLSSRFVESPAGVWWNDLAQNRRMRYEVTEMAQLRLGPDPGMALRYAKVGGR